MIHAEFGGNFNCKHSLGMKLQEKVFKVGIIKLICSQMLTEFIHSFIQHIFFWALISARGSVRGFEAAKETSYGLYPRGTPIREYATHIQ